MKLKAVFIFGTACAFLVSACGKDKDNGKNTTDKSALEQWNPNLEDIKGSTVAVGPWMLELPTDDNLKSYYFDDDENLTKLIHSSAIQFSAIIDSKGTKARFAAEFVKDHCENYKAAPAAGEVGGKTTDGINWFLKNQGANFESFTATAEKFNSCILMTVRSVENLSALSENGDVVRYLKAIANKITFDRFIFVHFNVDEIQSYFVTAFNAGFDPVEVNGITFGTAHDVFFTMDGKKNSLIGEARTGSCDNQLFKDAFADADKEELSIFSGPEITAKYSSKIISIDGKHNRIVEGVFKNSVDTNCLLMNFRLGTPVESISVVQDDKELEENLIYEMSVTGLVPKK